MNRKEFEAPGFDDPIKLNPDSPLAGKVQAHLSRRDFLNMALVGALGVAAVKGCKTFGIISPPPEGTKTNPTETVPPPERLPIDINSISVEKGSFTGTAINGEVRIGVINQSEIDTVWPKAEKALFAIQSQENILPGTSYELKGLKIIDAGGHEQVSLFADVNDGEKVFLYVETDQKGHFTPANTRDGQVEGRMIRMDVWSDGVSSFLGFENGEEKLPVFELDEKNNTYYIDPFSGVKVQVADSDVPHGISKALLSLVPMPEWTNSVPEGLIPVRNEDGTWGIGRKIDGEIVEIPGINFSESKLMLNLGDGETLDITQDINAINIVDHPSGALIIDKGERVGFVWKGDKWAEILLDIEFQTNGTELNNLPEITLEDIVSGRLAEAERLASQPFPEGVEPLNNYYYDLNISGVYPDIGGETGYEFSLHPEKFPMRFVYFYRAEINNIPVVMATLQVLNKDNTSIFIHIVENRKYINSYPDYWNKVIQLRYVPGFDMALGGDKYDACKNGWSEAVTQVVCPLNAPQKDRLQATMRELVEQQRIPEEFERILFVPNPGRWY